MRGVSDYAIVYDISSDKERRMVDKVLKDFGFRVQKSVFECRLNKSTKALLQKRLGQLNIETGFVKIYRLVYHSKNEQIGGGAKDEIDKGPAFIV